LAHDGANRHDQPLLEPTLQSIPIERPKPTPQQPQGLCLDRGYDSPPMHDVATKHGYTPHIRARGEEIKLKAHTPGWRARRWWAAPAFRSTTSERVVDVVGAR